MVEAELTKKDVGKKYLILEKSVSLTNDISRVDDIVIAHEWHDDIIAMKFKLVEDLFYLSSNTKLKEVKWDLKKKKKVFTITWIE